MELPTVLSHVDRLADFVFGHCHLLCDHQIESFLGFEVSSCANPARMSGQHQPSLLNLCAPARRSQGPQPQVHNLLRESSGGGV